jgi:uncharacterized protein (DUF1330 family)
MGANRKLALAVLLGIATGVACATAIHARQVKTPPPGYIIAEVDVTDATSLEKYGAKVPETLAPFNAQYVIRGGETISLEGEPPKTYVVMIAFDSVEKAQAWYDSPAYDAIKPIRQRSTKSRIFIAEGLAPK